jgi:hypothetical protein
MTTRRHLPLALLLAVAALAGAGCGSSDDGTSADDAQAAYQSVRAQITGLGASIAGAIDNASRSTDTQLSSAFSRLQDQGQAAVARLDRLDVPDDLQDERQALRDAVENGTNDLADIASAAKRSDAAAARKAAQQLVSDSSKIGAARAQLERALNDATR